MPSMRTMWFVWRLFIAFSCWFGAYRIFDYASSKESMYGAFAVLLFAAALLIAGAVAISPDLARWAAKPFNSFIDSLYLPGGREKKPPLSYSKADLCIRQGRYEDAEEALAEIIHYYPDELRAYLDMADICLKMDDPKAAEKALAKAHRRMHRDSEAIALIRATREKVMEAYSSEAV